MEVNYSPLAVLLLFLLAVRVLSCCPPSAPSTTLGWLEFPPCSWLLCHPGGAALPGQQPEIFLHATTSGKSSGNANQGRTQKPFPPTCCPKDVKLIHNHCCLVTGQADVPEMWWALRILCLLQCFYSIFSHLLIFAPAEGHTDAFTFPLQMLFVLWNSWVF